MSDESESKPTSVAVNTDWLCKICVLVLLGAQLGSGELVALL